MLILGMLKTLAIDFRQAFARVAAMSADHHLTALKGNALKSLLKGFYCFPKSTLCEGLEKK